LSFIGILHNVVFGGNQTIQENAVKLNYFNMLNTVMRYIQKSE